MVALLWGCSQYLVALGVELATCSPARHLNPHPYSSGSDPRKSSHTQNKLLLVKFI